MAGLLIILVFVDTFLSGWLVAQVLGIRRVIAQLTELYQSAGNQVDVMSRVVSPAEVVKDA